MAKAKLPENLSETGGKGWRECKSCGMYTKGGRTAVCANPDCGAEFPKKEKTAKSTGGSSLKEVLEQRLAEIENLLSSREALETEAERIRALLESIDA